MDTRQSTRERKPNIKYLGGDFVTFDSPKTSPKPKPTGAKKPKKNQEPTQK